MPNPPTRDPKPIEVAVAMVSDKPHPLISRSRWDAWRELLAAGGNAFAVAGTVDGRGTLVLAWDFISRPMGRAEVANLVAWLLMLSEVSAAELRPILAAQGVDLADVLGPEDSPSKDEPPTCGELGCIAPDGHSGDHTDGIGHWPRVPG